MKLKFDLQDLRTCTCLCGKNIRRTQDMYATSQIENAKANPFFGWLCDTPMYLALLYDVNNRVNY